MRPPVQRCFPPFLALLPTLYLLEQHAETPLVHVLLRVAENISRGGEGRNRRVSVGRRGRARGVRTRGDDARGVSRTMIFVSRPASRLSLAIFSSSTSGLVPLITSDPRPMGMANMVVKVNAPIARGFPRVPRTIQRHVGLFSHIQDMSPRPRTASIHNPIPVRGTQCAAKSHVGTLGENTEKTCPHVKSRLGPKSSLKNSPPVEFGLTVCPYRSLYACLNRK